MSNNNRSDKNIGIAFVLNFGFTLIEIFGAIITNSMAILADAIHDAGDSISLGISWVFERKSKKDPDKDYTYGYERFSLLGALISSFVLFGAAIYIFTETIPRLLSPEPVDAFGMILLSVLGIVFNGLAVIRVKSGSSHHEKIVTWHLLEDLLGWVAIMITSIILYFVDWYFLDPLLSMLITLYVIMHVMRNLIKVIRVLLQASPKDLDIKKLRKHIESIEGIKRAYHVHAWSLEGSKTMLTMHIIIERDINNGEVMALKKKVRDYLKDHNVGHSTIEIEYRK